MIDARTRAALVAVAGTVLAGSAAAHDGHGVDGVHWHAWDLGLVLLALAGNEASALRRASLATAG